jgi:hypothetical protein
MVDLWNKNLQPQYVRIPPETNWQSRQSRFDSSISCNIVNSVSRRARARFTKCIYLRHTIRNVTKLVLNTIDASDSLFSQMEIDWSSLLQYQCACENGSESNWKAPLGWFANGFVQLPFRSEETWIVYFAYRRH